MNVPDLDIIAGLEDAYFAVVRFVGSLSGNAITSQLVTPQRPQGFRISSASKLKQLRKIYTSYTQGRQQFWCDYGFPDDMTGWQKYVQLNAPRLTNMLPVLNEPPVPFGNKVINGTFYGIPPSPWVAGSALAEFKSAHIRVADNYYVVNTLVAYQILNLKNNTSYRVKFEYYSFLGEDGELGVGLGGNLGSLTYFYIATDLYGTKTFDFTTSSSGSQSIKIQFAVRGTINYLLISRVSVVQL